jgi:hypothetical protein
MTKHAYLFASAILPSHRSHRPTAQSLSFHAPHSHPLSRTTSLRRLSHTVAQSRPRPSRVKRRNPSPALAHSPRDPPPRVPKCTDVGMSTTASSSRLSHLSLRRECRLQRPRIPNAPRYPRPMETSTDQGEAQIPHTRCPLRDDHSGGVEQYTLSHLASPRFSSTRPDLDLDLLSDS